MIETKLGKVHKEYRDINQSVIVWIIGLTIAELGLIISQELYSLNWLFYSFIGISFISLLLAVMIMYCIISCVDIELYSVLLVHNSNGKMSKENHETKAMERLGKFTKLLVEIIFEKRFYRLLFISFALNTVGMIALIFCNIKNPVTTQVLSTVGRNERV